MEVGRISRVVLVVWSVADSLTPDPIPADFSLFDRCRSCRGNMTNGWLTEFRTDRFQVHGVLVPRSCYNTVLRLWSTVAVLKTDPPIHMASPVSAASPAVR